MAAKTKLAILGGGMGSLSTAFWLTSQPGWDQKYDITVYQMGWRLGGKAASGRNPAMAFRNEEHGYHMLFGFYENTFATMRACYQELGRSPDAPFSEFIAPTPEDEERYPGRYAMRRNRLLHLAEDFHGTTHTLNFHFPMNDRLPGDGEAVNLFAALRETWMWLWRSKADDLTFLSSGPTNFPIRVQQKLQEMKGVWSLVELGIKCRVDARQNHDDARAIYRPLVYYIECFLRDFWEEIKDRVSTEWEAYRKWILADLIGTTIRGFLIDDLAFSGFDSINDENYCDWLMRHATIPEGTRLTSSSILTQFAYDACFAYRSGDGLAPRTPEKPLQGMANMEAGTMLRGQLRLILTYKGAIDWLFQAGCGEVLVAPMYEVLQRRGVQFKFFHKVRQLVVPPGSECLEAIVMERQATLKEGDYQPLRMVKDLPCWPIQPLYDQLVEGDELRARKINLESHWTDWKGPEFTLKRGEDFDEVLLGISLGGLPHIAQDLIRENANWKAMVEEVKTIRTIGFQTWTNHTLEDMGWSKGKILTGTGVQPVNMEADATEMILREAWPVEGCPVNLTYFGGVMKDDPNEPQVPDPTYPETQRASLKRQAIDFLNRHASIYWPSSVTEQGFRWDWLAAPHQPQAEGEQRFESQFWQANIDPSERYVLSVVGSTRHRLKAGESGFRNLFLAGDWVKTGLNCGCMEATVMSGMQAARAIGDFPLKVVGETDFEQGMITSATLLDMI